MALRTSTSLRTINTVGYLQMPNLTGGGGVNGNSKCATPSKEAFNVYDDFTMIVKAQFDDYDTYAGAVLMSKWRGFGTTAGSAVARRTYRLVALTFGVDFYPETGPYRYFQISTTDEGSIHDAIFNSEIVYDIPENTPFWLKCYFKCDENGAGIRSTAQFYFSLETTNDPSQVTWTPLVTGPQSATGTGDDDPFANLYRDGTDNILYGIGAGAPGTAPLTQLSIGGNDKTQPGFADTAANSSIFNGKIYYAGLTTDGTEVARMDFTKAVAGVDGVVDALGNPFTLSKRAYITGTHNKLTNTLRTTKTLRTT